jgi:hypothetical protein
MKYEKDAPEVLRKAQDEAAARRQLLETGKIRLTPETAPTTPQQGQQGEAPQQDRAGGG